MFHFESDEADCDAPMETESNLNASVKSGSSIVYQLLDPADKQACKKLGSSVTSVAFYTYNDRCRSVNVASFLNGLWAHEGFGVSNNSGHEAQARLAAADPANNVYRLVERVFATNEIDVKFFAGNEAYQASQRISNVASSHNVVKNNWCGSVWRFSTSSNNWIFAPVLTVSGNCP